jgi:hypothetical protein
MSNTVRPKRRRHNLRLIKRDYSYSTLEVAELLNVSVVTVRRWLNEGLRRNDDHRPFLIRGEALISFVQTRQDARKSHCAENECYCFSCSRPRATWGGTIDLTIRNEKLLTLSGVCGACGKTIYRAGSVARLSSYQEVFRIQTIRDLRIIGSTASLYNDSLAKEPQDEPV